MISVYHIVIDGIDKSGKNMLLNYIVELCNHKYLVHDRGIISQLTYDRIVSGRQNSYNFDSIEKEEYGTLNVFLDVDFEDWKVRCKMTKEPSIDYVTHRNEFIKTINILKNRINIVSYNTSKMTPYNIAVDVIRKMDDLNNLKSK